MKRLENKVAIITGGADGLGKAGAEKFASEGAETIIWDVNSEKGEEVAKAINNQGGKARFMNVNTADLGAVEKATNEIISQSGKIDILVNNAGITRDASLKKMTPEQWQQVIDVNLTGVFNCTKIIGIHMTQNKYGRIINTSSVVALYGNFGQTNYVATKAGVIGMTKTWARELGFKGVTVNAVAPGFIMTDMVRKMPENVLETMQSKVPLGHLGDPEDIANAYLFLASDEARYVNGATLSVDGGMTI
ncbi:MAG TPA: 3-oxoacyl-ACP reductase FabG [Salinivirga sp.]|uniref:3-oxoacyl-[acyl-carrier-protein] reductase n=1 Tax=Salinivirga cyanobacteriivorans TaxID=1307839 RepID=A0A0S2I3W0_9BACT|nr:MULTISPECIES: 3-oxoacyl-ACP reductase FabG [Salinivirga]ALO17030.1 3-oxoacyl-[acyl-carrier-protein] reductase FabG [Salinivirga cyanobacteriivorans]HKK59541.1 3-oxoacyl-ACP reductase FabG [Salinivirga sp.]